MRVAPPNSNLRWFGRLYLLAAALYVLLGFVLIGTALARGLEVNPMIPVPSRFAEVPSGSDDASVQAYYDYLNYRHLDYLSETLTVDWLTITTVYGILAGILVIFYFLAMAWGARRSKADLYPVESFNGYISERGGPIDPFNLALYAILVCYMVYYTVVSLIYGQYY